jgi:hypothetical protein
MTGALHVESPLLDAQVLAVRTVPGAEGPHVRSAVRADAIKAVVLELKAARTPVEVPAIF